MVERYDVVIFTCRMLCDEPMRGDVAHAIAEWLGAHGCSHATVLRITMTHEKPHAGVYLDDRSIRFEGAFPTVAVIEWASVPWNKRPPCP